MDALPGAGRREQGERGEAAAANCYCCTSCCGQINVLDDVPRAVSLLGSPMELTRSILVGNTHTHARTRSWAACGWCRSAPTPISGPSCCMRCGRRWRSQARKRWAPAGLPPGHCCMMDAAHLPTHPALAPHPPVCRPLLCTALLLPSDPGHLWPSLAPANIALLLSLPILQAIVMGSDIPGVTAQVLHAAVRALDAFEVGPRGRRLPSFVPARQALLTSWAVDRGHTQCLGCRLVLACSHGDPGAPGCPWQPWVARALQKHKQPCGWVRRPRVFDSMFAQLLRRWSLGLLWTGATTCLGSGGCEWRAPCSRCEEIQTV